MVISPFPPLPPNPMGCTGEICKRNALDTGLSGDPFGITDALTAISNVWVAKKQGDANKKYIALENKKLQAQNEETRRLAAEAQADALIEPYRQARYIQIAALGAVAVVGAAISIMFLKSAIKAGSEGPFE